MTIVYDAYVDYLVNKDKEDTKEYRERKLRETDKTKKGKLWPSDMGKCKRAVMFRVNGIRAEHEFPVKALDYMNTGVVMETSTAEALKHAYGDRFTEQVDLKYNLWSGKADFGIDIGGDSPVIIEHKTTSEKNFSTDGSTAMPKREHIGQAMLYCYLYEMLYNKTPKIVLFYKAWGIFAEFSLTRIENRIRVESYVNGAVDTFDVDYDVYGEIEELHNWYNSKDLPPKLEKKYMGCSFRGQPSCPYYERCWGEG